MKTKAVLFITGAVMLAMGGLPLLGRTIPATAELIKGMPEAGSIVYQLILVLFGLIAIGYALKKEGPKKELMKLLKAGQ